MKKSWNDYATFLNLLVTAKRSLSTLAHNPVASVAPSGGNMGTPKKTLMLPNHQGHTRRVVRALSQDAKVSTQLKRAQYIKWYNEENKTRLLLQRQEYRRRRKNELLQNIRNNPDIKVLTLF